MDNNSSNSQRYRSYAQWPIEMGAGYDLVTTDDHDTEEQADAACEMLQRNGMGGDGKIFPKNTWVKPIIHHVF